MEELHFTDEQIDDYIMGVLEEEKRPLFDKTLRKDQDLNIRLNQRRELIKGIEAYHRLQLKNKLKQIHEKAFVSPVQPIAKRRNLRPWISIAAAIALLVVALVWITNQTPASEQLFADHFQAYELSLSQRGDTEQELVQLEKLYNNKDYEAALPLFESLLQENEESIQLQLGAGVTKLSLGNPKEALAYFNRIIRSNDLLFKDQAIWYAALAHLKMDDQEAAKKQLELLANDPDADHHQDAVTLLEKL